jgi:hypothetical protein
MMAGTMVAGPSHELDSDQLEMALAMLGGLRWFFPSWLDAPPIKVPTIVLCPSSTPLDAETTYSKAVDPMALHSDYESGDSDGDSDDVDSDSESYEDDTDSTDF